MRTIRKRFWYPLVSLLLVAVLVPVQAAGCCRLTAILGFGPDSGPRTAENGAAVAENAVPATAAEATMQSHHSCCARKTGDGESTADAARAHGDAAVHAGDAAGQGQASGDCHAASGGCCLKRSPHAEPGLLSDASSPLSDAPVLNRLRAEPLPAAPLLPSLDLPADSGPPVYLACRRLLI